jgi:hypothetical protein
MLKSLIAIALSLVLPLACRAGDVQYVSTAKLLVGGVEVNPKLKNGELIPESFYATMIELLQSSAILKSASARVHSLHPDLPYQPCKLEAARLPGTRIIVLRTSAPERAYARAYLDSVMDEFLAKGKEIHRGGHDTLFAVMDEIVHEIFLAEKEIKAAEQNGTKPEQLVEAKAKVQQDWMFHKRLVATAQKLEDQARVGSGGEVFSVIERATDPVAIQPGSPLPDLLKKQQ